MSLDPLQGPPPSDDPGDDVQRRFRYQNTLAALEALALIDDSLKEPIGAIICEQFEDILIELPSGVYIAVAVKTRLAAEQHRATDPEIASACRRFCLLHRVLGEDVKSFVLHSSVGFNSAATKTSLPHMIELAKSVETAEAFGELSKAKSFITAVCQGEATLDDLFVVLRKLLPRLGPRLDAIESTYIAKVTQLVRFGSWPLSSVTLFAKRLVGATMYAASLRSEDDDASYLSELAESRADYERKLAGKRIDRDSLDAMLREVESAAATDEYAVSEMPVPIGSTMLERKMALGMFNIDNIQLAQRQKEHVESVFLGWRSRYRGSKAVQRIRKVEVVVQSAFVESKDEVRANGKLSGPRIMEKVRARLEKISSTRKDDVFGLGYEQLLGVAAVLTDQCDIWWSSSRSLPNAE